MPHHNTMRTSCHSDSLLLKGLCCYVSSDKPVGSTKMHRKIIFRTLKGINSVDFFTGLISLIPVHQSCRELPLFSCQTLLCCVTALWEQFVSKWYWGRLMLLGMDMCSTAITLFCLAQLQSGSVWTKAQAVLAAWLFCSSNGKKGQGMIRVLFWCT